MQKTLLLLLSICSLVLLSSAQTDKAEYGATMMPISGVAVTSTGTVYSFSGKDWVSGFPDTLSLVNENDLIPQRDSPFGVRSKADVYFSPADDRYYMLELNYPLGCEAPYDTMFVISFPRDDPNQILKVEVIGPNLDLGAYTGFVASGNRFAIQFRDKTIVSSFTNPFDKFIANLNEENNFLFPTKIVAIDEKIYVADGAELLVIDTDDEVTKVMFNEPILGLGHYSSISSDVYVVTTVAGY